MLAKLVRPHHLKLFFSNKHLHASIISKVNDHCVVSVSTNNKFFTNKLGIYAVKNDERACEAAAKVLVEKALQRKVKTLFWDGRLTQKTTKKKFKPAAVHLWESIAREAPQLRLIRKDEGEESEDENDKEPVSVKALTKKSRIDPGFRQEMWRLLSKAHEERVGGKQGGGGEA